MSNQENFDATLEHAKTLDVISKFCRAAFTLVDAQAMPSVYKAMLALLSEIDLELDRVGIVPLKDMHHSVEPEPLLSET
nr:hypothetical protein [Methylobacterium sp. L1A1]